MPSGPGARSVLETLTLQPVVATVWMATLVPAVPPRAWVEPVLHSAAGMGRVMMVCLGLACANVLPDGTVLAVTYVSTTPPLLAQRAMIFAVTVVGAAGDVAVAQGSIIVCHACVTGRA
jgi:hypothetical protein